jgi:hypothetical protein
VFLFAKKHFKQHSKPSRDFMKIASMKIISTLALSLLLAACATPTVVKTVKPGDNGLTCPQLQNEYSEAEQLKETAQKEKGVTGGNVARALLFWPAILGTASNANEAIAAADTRMTYLANIMTQKSCDVPVPTPKVEAAKPAATK